jgi:hypothetical protein
MPNVEIAAICDVDELVLEQRLQDAEKLTRKRPAGYTNLLQEAVKLAREGVIGDVYLSRGLCYKWRDTIGREPIEPVPAGVHYDLWLEPAPKREFTRNRSLSGSATNRRRRPRFTCMPTYNPRSAHSHMPPRTATAAGGGSSGAALFRGDGAVDRGAALADRIERGGGQANRSKEVGRRRGV